MPSPFTSSANGVWNNGLTWGSVNNPGVAGVDYPTTGDIATITTHAVSISNGMTANVGSSPTSATATVDFVISSTGSLTIDAGGVFNCKTPWDITGGGVITNNGTFNTDPSGQATVTEYRARVGVTGTGKLVVGPGGIMTAPVGYAWYQASGAVSNAGQLDINGTESDRALFERMTRSSDARGWLVGLNITSAGKFEASHCTFDSCDDFSFTGSGTYTILWEWCKWVNSTGTQNIILATTTVTKQFYHCTFDKNPQVSGAWGSTQATVIDCDECYFDGGYTAGTSTGGFVDGRYNVKRSSVAGGVQNPTPFTPPSGGTRVTHEILWKDTTNTNQHWGGINGSGTGARTVEGPIYLYEGSGGDGDCVMPDPSDNVLTTLRHLLFGRNGNGGQVGTWLSQLGESSPGTSHTIAYEHCTGVIAGTGTRGISVGETATCAADRVVSVKSNLAIEQSAGNYPGGTEGLLTQMQLSQSTNDPFTETGIDYNWIFATNVTSAATAYASTATSPAVGTQTLPAAANDLYGEDPECTDTFRRMPEWAAWWGARIGANGDGINTPNADATKENARLLWLAMHDGSFPETITSTAARLNVQWIRRGWIPTNPAGRGAGHDGLTMGLWGGWMPVVTTPTVSGSTASCTANCVDGTDYWVITQAATPPDWDRMLAGQDHTGTAVATGFSGNQAATGTAISIDISGAALGAGDYYIHVVRKSADTEALLDDYLHTAETATSAAFQSASGSIPRRTLNLQLQLAA